MTPSKLIEAVVILFFIATVAVCWAMFTGQIKKSSEYQQIMGGCK